jgi:hypothetical protein
VRAAVTQACVSSYFFVNILRNLLRSSQLHTNALHEDCRADDRKICLVSSEKIVRISPEIVRLHLS